MYCPKCLNDSLALCSHGIVHVIVNGKQMEAGRFLFNLGRETEDEIIENFKGKLEDFFKWYASFKNRVPITKVQICSGDFQCQNDCKIDLNSRFSVADILIPKKTIQLALKELSEKYEIDVDFKNFT